MCTGINKTQEKHGKKKNKQVSRKDQPEIEKLPAPFYLLETLLSKHSVLMSFATLIASHCICSSRTPWKCPVAPNRGKKKKNTKTKPKKSDNYIKVYAQRQNLKETIT